jgi:Flp pilus assembly protein TadD
VAAIYAKSAGHPFVSLDDEDYVTANRVVARGLSASGLVWAFTRAHAANWHPLSWISHMVDAQMFGVTDAAAGGHHLVSVALHAVNAVLLFAALRLLSGRLAASAWVAALFAVHPLRVESVAWVSERKDVLSGLFFLLALIGYARFARRPSPRALLPVLAAQVAGLLAKPTLVTLPLVLLLLDVWPLGRWAPGSRRARMVEKIPLFAASLVAGIATILAQRAEGAVAAIGAISIQARLANAVASIGIYLAKLAWPSGLSCFHPHPATLAASPSWPLAATASGVVAAGLSAVAWRLRRGRPFLPVGWLWFLVVLAPMIGLLQVGNQGWAERYTYLSSIGILIAVVWLAADLVKGRPAAARVATALAAVIVLAFAFLARRQVEVWSSTDALYRHALQVDPDNWFAENALGVRAMHEGRSDDALRHFERSLNDLAPGLRPGYREAHNNLGLLLLQTGRFSDARRELEQALAPGPRFPQAHNNLALLALREGRLDEARAHAEQAVALAPDFADARFNWGLALQAQGRLEEAARQFERVVELEPMDGEAHAQLGRLLAALGRPSEARGELERAVRLAPGHPWAREALAELGRAR